MTRLEIRKWNAHGCISLLPPPPLLIFPTFHDPPTMALHLKSIATPPNGTATLDLMVVYSAALYGRELVVSCKEWERTFDANALASLQSSLSSHISRSAVISNTRSFSRVTLPYDDSRFLRRPTDSIQRSSNLSAPSTKLNLGVPSGITPVA